MDSTLHERLMQKLGQLAAAASEPESALEMDYANPGAVLDYIETNIITLDELWSSVASNVDKLRATRKDVALAEVSYVEAIYKFEQIQHDRIGSENMDKADKKARRKIVKEVLKLVDKAIVNCPFVGNVAASAVQLDALYSLRAAALLEYELPQLALVAANRALSLAPDSRAAHAQKAQALMVLDRVPEAYRLLKRYYRQIHLYPRALEEDEATSAQFDEEQFIAAKSLEAIYEERIRKLLWEAIELCEPNQDVDRSDADDVDKLALLIEEAESEDVSKDEAADDDPYQKPYEETRKSFSLDYRCSFERSRKGRCIVATDGIPAHTLLFREQPYSMVVLEQAQLFVCHYCGRDVRNRFWPCARCNHTVYCGEECARLDRKLSHGIECGFVGYWVGKSKSTYHVFRLLNRLGIRDAMAAAEAQRHSPYDLLDYRWDETLRCTREVDKSKADLRRTFQAQMSLLDHSDKYQIDCLAYNMTNAIECALMACVAQGFEFSQFTRDQLIELISECFLSIRRVLTNAFRWTEADESGDKCHIATCYMLMASMFNHSCEPNVEWSIRNGYIRLITSQPIKAGQEVMLSYGPNSEADFFEARQERLQANYFFQCNCSACVSDARYVLALQCLSCSGPVLPSSDENDARCLVCNSSFPQSAAAFKRLTTARTNLDALCLLWPYCDSYILGGKITDDERLDSLRGQLREIEMLIYRQSLLWVQSAYVACKILHQKGFVSECTLYGKQIDAILPFKSIGLGLIALPAPKSKSDEDSVDEQGDVEQPFAPTTEYTSSDAFGPNIDHMIFWTSVYRDYIVSTATTKSHEEEDEESTSAIVVDPERAKIWQQMLHFYKRLHKLIKWAYTHKREKLEQLGHKKDQFEHAGLAEEINVLELLDQNKIDELDRLKLNYGAHFE